jgi:hypothetical protein
MLYTRMVCRKGALFLFSGFYIIDAQLYYQIFVIVADRDKLISVG